MGRVWVGFGVVLGMEGVVVSVCVVLVILLNAFILNLSLKQRAHLSVLEQGVAGAFQAIHDRLQEIVDLPEALSGIGGVQLMPQKTFGEIAMEHIMNRFFGTERLNEHPVSDKAWQQPDVEQPSNELDENSQA